MQQYGPCSRKKVLLEARRLEKLYRSIKRHGVNQHIDSNDYPSGYFLLKKNGAYRFILNNGQHRLAAYYVFGERRIFVTLDKYGRPAIVRETDANLWPMVREGKVTKDDGLRVFDCYFRNHESGNAH